MISHRRLDIEGAELTFADDLLAVDKGIIHPERSAHQQRRQGIALRARQAELVQPYGDEIGAHAGRQMTDIVAAEDRCTSPCRHLIRLPRRKCLWCSAESAAATRLLRQIVMRRDAL